MSWNSPSTILAASVVALATGHGSFASCPGDLDGSGLVDGNDLGLMLGAWGSIDPLSLIHISEPTRPY